MESFLYFDVKGFEMLRLRNWRVFLDQSSSDAASEKISRENCDKVVSI